MAKRTKKEVEMTAEKLGWKVEWDEQYSNRTGETTKMVTFSQYSPAGEDFSFYEIYDSIPHISELVYEHYVDFDPDEHAVSWYGANRGEPCALQDLLDDAKAIENMLLGLATALS